MPIDPKINVLEKSFGANWHTNYRTLFKIQISIHIHQLFFFKHLTKSLQLIPIVGSCFKFVILLGSLETKGTETNVKLGCEDCNLF